MVLRVEKYVAQTQGDYQMRAREYLDRKPNLLDLAIRGAHTICNRVFLFDAVEMSDEDIRSILGEYNIIDRELQDAYIQFVRMYKVVMH